MNIQNQILNQIKAHDVIIIHRHARPDGDALGSQMGLKEALVHNFPKKKIYAVGDTSDRLSFIGDIDDIQDEVYNDALVFVLDTADTHMISDERYKSGKVMIKMDHHISSNDYGDINLVDTSYESCAGLVAQFLLDVGLDLNKESAQALFTGIITDSGRFRYDSTNARTFRIVSSLLETGFTPSTIYDQLYVEDLENVRLRAYFMLNFQTTKNQVAYMINKKEDVERFGVDFFTISRGMVNTMAGIRGISVWANFTWDERAQGIVVELRSNQFNINQIAVKYGGGGHRLASGATLPSWEVVDEMLKDLDQLVMEGNHE